MALFRRQSSIAQDLEAVRASLVVGGHAFVAFAVTGTGAVEVAPGLLYCNGAVVSRTTYKRLFDRIGTANNIGGEAGTDFRLPDGRGRIMSFDPDGQTGNGRLATSRGAVAGAETHPLDLAEIPGHVHDKGSMAITNGGSHTHSHSFTLTCTDGNNSTGANPASGAGASGAPFTPEGSLSNDGAHTHPSGEWSGVSGDGTADGLNNGASGTAHENVPPAQACGAVLIAY